MKKLLVVGLVGLSIGVATSARADDGRYHQVKEVFEEAEGLRIESVLALVTPSSNGKYYLQGTCFEPDGETWTNGVIVNLPARPSADPGAGDFFVEEELSAVEFNNYRYEYDRERGVYVAMPSSFKAVERNGEHYLLEEYPLPDEIDYCVYALE